MNFSTDAKNNTATDKNICVFRGKKACVEFSRKNAGGFLSLVLGDRSSQTLIRKNQKSFQVLWFDFLLK
jgi:hypothetical protein